MIKLSRHEFESRLFGVSKCQFVGLTALTAPDMRKTGNPYAGTTVKISRVSGCINWRYESAVRRQQARENRPADFQSQPRKWGNRIDGCPLVCHVRPDVGVTLYLEVKVEQVTAGYFSTNTGQRIDDALLRPFFPKKSASRQGVDREVQLRDYRLDHIAELRIAGEDWHVTPLWFEYQTYMNPPEAMGASA